MVKKTSKEITNKLTIYILFFLIIFFFVEIIVNKYCFLIAILFLLFKFLIIAANSKVIIYNDCFYLVFPDKLPVKLRFDEINEINIKGCKFSVKDIHDNIYDLYFFNNKAKYIQLINNIQKVKICNNSMSGGA